MLLRIYFILKLLSLFQIFAQVWYFQIWITSDSWWKNIVLDIMCRSLYWLWFLKISVWWMILNQSYHKARRVTTFVYRHGHMLDAFRKLANRDLVRTGVTRFATTFLTLQSLYQNKEALRQLVTGEDWIRSSVSKQRMEKVSATQF